MVFHYNLNDRRFLQVSRILLSILTYPNNAVVWIVSTRILISISSNPFINPSGTIPSVPTTIGITVTFMVFLFSSKVQVVIFLFAFFQVYSVISWIGRFSFLLSLTRSGHLAEIRWSACISKSQRIECVSFSRTDSCLCIYLLFLGSNLNFLHRFYWIIFPTHSWVVFYFVW